MLAPVIAAALAFFAGLGAGSYAPPRLATAATGESVVAGVYADLPKICAATDPLVDALQDFNPKSAALTRLTGVADAVCLAVRRPDDPLDRAALVIDAIQALEKANRKIASVPAPATRPDPRKRWTARRGRG